MTDSTGEDATSTPSRQQLLETLRADAEYCQPRLFAIYGICKEVSEFIPEKPFVVWGIDSTEGGAVLWCPHEQWVHTSDSADRILMSYQRRGEAHLLWLE
jgi:hypothetical protein